MLSIVLSADLSVSAFWLKAVRVLNTIRILRQRHKLHNQTLSSKLGLNHVTPTLLNNLSWKCTVTDLFRSVKLMQWALKRLPMRVNQTFRDSIINHQRRKSYPRNTFSHFLSSSHCVSDMPRDLIQFSLLLC